MYLSQSFDKEIFFVANASPLLQFIRFVILFAKCLVGYTLLWCSASVKVPQ